VIAEGVETAGQLEHLRVLGCEFAQGFHVSAPLAAREARALLAQGTLSVSS
jgi:EAL domain-containing protein (putative c-di-GMP-specific phosphodiesterase class I)